MIGPDWPLDRHPDVVPVHTRVERRLDAPPEAVWAVLADLHGWPTWWAGCRWARPEGVPGPGAPFAWHAFGVTLRGTVTQWEPGARLGYDLATVGVRGAARWRLAPQGGGCHVVLEETQRGPLPAVLRGVQRRNVARGHAGWLAALDARVRHS